MFKIIVLKKIKSHKCFENFELSEIAHLHKTKYTSLK